MGAWGTGNFDNDDALDWIATLEEQGLLAAGVAIHEVLSLADDYLEAPTCCAALAAAEVVAALRGRRAAELPRELEAWLDGAPDDPGAELTRNARLAVEAILRRSELRELWGESDEGATWERVVMDLRQRLV